MFTFLGHRQILLAVVALACLVNFGCAKKSDTAQTTAKNSAEAAAPQRDVLKKPQPGDVAELVTLLSSKEASTRTDAAKALAILKTDASGAVADLQKALKDNSSDVRASAASALAAIGDNAVVQDLSAAAVEEQDEDARAKMWAALGLLGATSAITNTEMTPADRSAAIGGVRESGDEKIVSEVISQWLSSDNPETRSTGLQQYAEDSSDNEDMVAQVVGLLLDEDESVRKQASDVVKSMKLSKKQQVSSVLNRLMMARSDEETESIKKDFSKDSEALAAPLLALVGNPDSSVEERKLALALLSEQPQAFLANNLDALTALQLPKDADDATADSLTFNLMKAGGKPNQKSLLQLALSPQVDTDMRIQALGRLQPSENSDVGKKLGEALTQSVATQTSDESQQKLAMSLLGAIEAQGPGGRAAASDIAQLGTHTNSNLGIAALDTLLAVDPSSAETTAALKAAIAADDQKLNSHALAAIEKVDASQLLALFPELANRMARSTDEEKSTILGLLAKGGPKSLSAAAPAIADSLANAKSSEERKTLLGLLAQMEGSEFDASESLASALADKDPEVAATALKLLSKSTPQQIAQVAPMLAAALESGTAEQKTTAMELLAKGGQPALNAAAPAIAKILETAPESLDNTQLLGLLADVDGATDGFAPALAGMLASDDTAIKKQAMGLLKKTSPETLRSIAPQLTTQLRSSDADLTASLLDLLTKAGDDSLASAAPELANKLEASKDPKQRQQILSLLSKMELPPEQKRATAMAALSDKDAGVRTKALAMMMESDQSSAEMLKQLMAAMEDKSAAVRKQAMKGLAAAGKDAADAKPLLQNILNDTSDPASRRMAMSALSKMATPEESQALLNQALTDAKLRSESAKLVSKNPVEGIAAVANALESEDGDTANFAADLLSKMSGNKSGRKGLAALARESDQHRGLALLRLGSIPKNVPKKAAANALLPFIRRGEEGDTAWRLMNGLGDEALPTLNKIVVDDQMAPEARKRALKMIAGSDNVEIAGPILESLVVEDSTPLGTEAALALAMVDPSSSAAADRIVAALENPDPSFESAVLMKQLKAMKTDSSDAMRRLLNASDVSDSIRKQALEQLLAESPVSEETAASLQKAIALEDSEVSLAAALKLAQLGSPPPEVTERLIAELSGEQATANPQVLRALSAIGPAAGSSAKALADLAIRDPANAEVLKTIAALGDSAGPALAAVRSALESDDPKIRGLALETLVASKDSSPATMESLRKIEDPDLKARAGELVADLEKQIAPSATVNMGTTSEGAFVVDSGSAVGQSGSNCQPCEGATSACGTLSCAHMSCQPTDCCQQSRCEPVERLSPCQPATNCERISSCQPVWHPVAQSNISCRKVKVKTVSFRKYQKIQARMSKRGRR